MVSTTEVNQDIEPIEWVDEATKLVVKQALEAGEQGDWRRVYQASLELAHLCAVRGLLPTQFSTLMTNIMDALEKKIPLARTYFQIARNKERTLSY